MIRELTIILLCAIITVHSAHFKVTSQISFDIEIDKEFVGTITVGLFGDDSPKTVKNFRTICTKGINGKSYNGTKFHRVLDRFIIQGGDIVSGDGRGSVSIYGKHFEDENLTVAHTGPGFIGMANSGPDKNDFISLPISTATDGDRKPLKEIVINNCRDEPMSSSYYYISDNPYDLHAWIRASAIPVGFSFLVLACFHMLIRKLVRMIKGDITDDYDDANDQKNK